MMVDEDVRSLGNIQAAQSMGHGTVMRTDLCTSFYTMMRRDTPSIHWPERLCVRKCPADEYITPSEEASKCLIHQSSHPVQY